MKNNREIVTVGKLIGKTQILCGLAGLLIAGIPGGMIALGASMLMPSKKEVEVKKEEEPEQ